MPLPITDTKKRSSALHGANFYDGKKIVVGLTVRGKYADIFYGHIGQANGTSDNDEKEADFFARETLIPS